MLPVVMMMMNVCGVLLSAKTEYFRHGRVCVCDTVSPKPHAKVFVIPPSLSPYPPTSLQTSLGMNRCAMDSLLLGSRC